VGDVSGVVENTRRPVAITPGRSRNMAGIRRTDTKPELALRSALHKLGYRFRKDFRVDADGIKVRPDIVFTRLRIAVFVDGCFWHSCPDHGHAPTSNVWYWSEKLARNCARDTHVSTALTAAGWTVLRCWEHEPVAEVIDRLISEISHAQDVLCERRAKQSD
jgi:DNA mismatch endonuclease (patch repair protein)